MKMMKVMKIFKKMHNNSKISCFKAKVCSQILRKRDEMIFKLPLKLVLGKKISLPSLPNLSFLEDSLCRKLRTKSLTERGETKQKKNQHWSLVINMLRKEKSTLRTLVLHQFLKTRNFQSIQQILTIKKRKPKS